MTRLYNEYLLEKSCIIAEKRENRPFVEKDKTKCPFCLGNEYMLENIWLEYRSEVEKEIAIRIVNNKYPLCDEKSNLYGVHDVVIDTFNHDAKPEEYSANHWKAIFLSMQIRWKELKENPRIKFIQIFKNFGSRAGASIAHSHWQIVALEEIPYTMQIEYKRSLGRCIICESIEEISEEYIIFKGKEWSVVASQTPQMAYETWIIPNKHITNYEQVDEQLMQELGEVMVKLINGYNKVKEEIAYNICFMSEKPNIQNNYHFYIKIIPRENNFGGFELATGCSISTIDPKVCAREISKSFI